ncbi:hypothetical protein SGRI78S_02229 [Streptomyces griseus subsp. griseus]
MKDRSKTMTVSPVDFVPVVSTVMMPCPGRDRDSRLSRMRLVAYRVSPTKTGVFSRTLSQPRLATARADSACTVIPPTRHSVMPLFTRTFPYSAPAP